VSRVVVVGDLMIDVVAVASQPLARGSDAPARISSRGGGGGANVAAWLAAERVPVSLVARAGNDPAGRAAVAELERVGVQARVTLDPGRATGTCVVVVEPDGERTMLPDRGANLGLSPGDLPAELFTAEGHLHLSGYTLLEEGGRAAGLAALERDREAGMSISVDPSSAAPLKRCGAATFLDWVGRAVLLPNADEARVLGRARDPETAAKRLAAVGGEVVVTLGAAGALWTDGERTLRKPPAKRAPVDSTGAGDAFTAGWIAARRAGAEPAEALGVANDLAARALTVTGAR